MNQTRLQQFSGATLDRLYNNRGLVPDFAQHLSRWAADSARARTEQACLLDVPYGAGPNETLDLFPAVAVTSPAPVLVFLHGGYWRGLDKADHSFVAPPFTQTGACVVVPNYALCPTVTVPQIVMQMVQALAWTWRHVAQYGGDPKRITVAGHSAGGHLAAMLLACQWQRWAADLPPRLVRNALSISGLYELDSIRRTPHLQVDLRLTPAQARKASPACLPSPGLVSGRGQLYSVAGGDESEAFLLQNRLIQQAWGRRTVPVCGLVPGLNHFSMLGALAQPGTRVNQLAAELLA